MQRKAVLYDKAGDQHYDYISAWIKSTRGSDPDASLYYLAAMLEGGEDARYIARRMIVLASEDIGNADPQALPIAIAAAQAVEHVGVPECQFALAQAAIYLSLAPKSNAAKRAILGARAHIAERGAEPPPGALRNAAIPAMRKMGRGVGYENPHDEPGHVNDQEHLPAGREGVRFYAPDDGEPALRERLAELRRARGREPRPKAGDEPLGEAETLLRPHRALVRRDAGRGPADRGGDPRGARRRAHGPERRRRGGRLRAARPGGHRGRAVAVMRAQRPPGAAPCIDARAEALPFADGAFDAAMAVLSDHHWSDRLAGCGSCGASGGARSCSSGTRRTSARSGCARYLPTFARADDGRFEAAKAALGATRDDRRPDPARLPRRVPDGVLAPAGGVPRPDRAREHLGLLAAAAGRGRGDGRGAARRPGERRVGARATPSWSGSDEHDFGYRLLVAE